VVAVFVAVRSELSVAVAVGLETGGDGGGAVCGDGGGGSRSLRPGFCDSAGVGDGADTVVSTRVGITGLCLYNDKTLEPQGVAAASYDDDDDDDDNIIYRVTRVVVTVTAADQ